MARSAGGFIATTVGRVRIIDRMRNRVVVAAILAIGAVVVLALVSQPSTFTVAPGARTASDIIDRWLRAMAGAEPDRGWNYLSPELQAEAYGGDQDAYIGEIASVDWSAVRWGPTRGSVDDRVIFTGSSDLLSDPRTLPAFLTRRHLARPYCVDASPMGIHTGMQTGWFMTLGIGPTYWTGSGDECAAEFFTDTGPMRAPADLVGTATGMLGRSVTSVRVEVVDPAGLVRSASGGREDPPIEGDVTVSDAGRAVSVAWKASVCGDPVRITLTPSGDRLELLLWTIERPRESCASRTITYDLMLAIEGYAADDITVTREVLVIE